MTVGARIGGVRAKLPNNMEPNTVINQVYEEDPSKRSSLFLE